MNGDAASDFVHLQAQDRNYDIEDDDELKRL